MNTNLALKPTPVVTFAPKVSADDLRELAKPFVLDKILIPGNFGATSNWEIAMRARQEAQHSAFCAQRQAIEAQVLSEFSDAPAIEHRLQMKSPLYCEDTPLHESLSHFCDGFYLREGEPIDRVAAPFKPVFNIASTLAEQMHELGTSVDALALAVETGRASRLIEALNPSIDGEPSNAVIASTSQRFALLIEVQKYFQKELQCQVDVPGLLLAYWRANTPDGDLDAAKSALCSALSATIQSCDSFVSTLRNIESRATLSTVKSLTEIADVIGGVSTAIAGNTYLDLAQNQTAVDSHFPLNNELHALRVAWRRVNDTLNTKVEHIERQGLREAIQCLFGAEGARDLPRVIVAALDLAGEKLQSGSGHLFETVRTGFLKHLNERGFTAHEQVLSNMIHSDSEERLLWVTYWEAVTLHAIDIAVMRSVHDQIKPFDA